MAKQQSILWFRQDLRLTDNPALLAAAESESCLPIYIVDTSNTGNWPPGAASKWWLYHSLARLNESLDSKLQLFIGDPKKIIPQLAREHSISNVCWNRCYEPWQIARDKEIKHLLHAQSVEVKSFNGNLLWEPWTVLKKDSTPYKVFTPYYRNGCLQQASPRFPINTPAKINFYAKNIPSALTLNELNLLPNIYWYSGLEQQWQPGEKGAAKRLSRFLKSAIGAYKNDRNIPAVNGSSLLSPHLHFGEISPNQIWYAALHAAKDTDDENLNHFLSELGWREFSHYLLYHFPTLAEENFQTKFDNFPWHKNPPALQAWQQGKTGIPIVDAGMRELWQTGFMHNRVRMIVASFLVKNLLIDWREGEKWFWDTLVDADLAANSSSWQWVAGSGADAAPYFRIFNPVTQGEKFDPKGDYVRRYCPELNALPDRFIHKPWSAPAEILTQANLTLGTDYPEPIADLKLSRERALAAFKSLR